MDIERALISRLVLDGAMAAALDENLGPSLFEGEARKIWNWSVSHYRRYGSSPGTQALLAAFPDFVMDTPTEVVPVYADMLRRKYAHNVQVDAMRRAEEILRERNDPMQAADVLRAAVRAIDEIAAREADVNWKIGAESRVEDYDRAKEFGGITGFTSPFPTLDLYTTGWQPEDLILGIARQGVGKTWLETVFAHHHWLTGGKPLLFTNEMAAQQICRRLDAWHAKLPYQQFRRGLLDTVADERYRERMATLGTDDKEDFWVVGESGGSVSFVAAKIERYKPTMVFIDGMYLMSDEQRADSNWLAITNIARGLKQLAKALKPPIFATVQFNRGGKTADDVAYADISKECDVMVGLARSEDQRLQGTMDVNLLKQREGQLFSMEVAWDLDIMQIEEMGSVDTRTTPDEQVEEEGSDVVEFTD